jgi:hypothetical protein
MVKPKPIPYMPDAHKPTSTVYFSYFYNTEWYSDSDSDSDDDNAETVPIPEWVGYIKAEPQFRSETGQHQHIGFAKLKPTARILDQERDARIIYSYLRDRFAGTFDWTAMIRAGYQGIRITNPTGFIFNLWNIATLAVWDTDALCDRVYYKPFPGRSWYYVDEPVHDAAAAADASDDDTSYGLSEQLGFM